MNSLRLISALTIALATAPLAVHADVRVGDASSASAAAGTNLPELLLLIWDPVAKVSYTKDLGILAYSSNYAAGDTSKNLHVYGQQDAGYQKLFTPLNSDPLFQQFLSQSTTANQVWGIMGAQIDPEMEGGLPFWKSAFFTLNAGTQASGVRNQHYSWLTGLKEDGTPGGSGQVFTNAELGDAVGNFLIYATKLNDAEGNAANNTHKCGITPEACSTANAAVKDGSSFDTILSGGYANILLTEGALVANGHGSIMNPVGKSSWFYSATQATDVSDDRLLVDEFDNLSHDAYWGLGVAANGDYILSYTLAPHLAQPESAAGSLLRLRTDFAAVYGSTRLIGAPAGDTLDLGNSISPVPEPATWGLMGLGLAFLATRARRSRA